jgi:hypothetical protein
VSKEQAASSNIAMSSSGQCNLSAVGIRSCGRRLYIGITAEVKPESGWGTQKKKEEFLASGK